MGEGQFGGDGSVNWDIDTTKDDTYKFKNQGPSGGNKGRKVSGIDETFGDDFVISVKPPNGTSAAQLKASLENGGLTIDGDYVVFRVPIQNKEKRQVVVSWREDRNTTSTAS